MLDHANLSAPLIPNPILKLYKETGVAHGDGHPGNAMKNRFSKNIASFSLECIDFERSYLPNPSIEPASIMQTITSYYDARSEEERSCLLKNVIKNQGLERTRSNFRQFACACLKNSEPQDLFLHGVADFLKIFERREG
jgi:hypothetical protein